MRREKITYLPPAADEVSERPVIDDSGQDIPHHEPSDNWELASNDSDDLVFVTHCLCGDLGCHFTVNAPVSEVMHDCGDLRGAEALDSEHWSDCEHWDREEWRLG
jgi:hypothetical protein